MSTHILLLVVFAGVFFLAMILSSSFTTRLLVVMLTLLVILVAINSNLLEPAGMEVSEESFKIMIVDEGFKEDVWECGNCLTIEIEQVFDEKKPFPVCPRCGSTSRGRSDKHIYSVFLLVDGERELMYKYFTYSK